MKILVDMDGVTVNMVDKLLNKLNGHFDTNFKHEDITEWNFFSEGSTFALLTEEQKQFARKLLDEPGFCRDLELIPHVDEILSGLVKSGCSVTWLTAPWKTSKTWIEDRKAMVMEKLAHISTDIVFSWNKEETPGDLLIDDNPEFLLKWINKNFKNRAHSQVLLFKQPWNANFGEDNKIQFMDGWKDKVLSHAVVAHRIFR